MSIHDSEAFQIRQEGALPIAPPVVYECPRCGSGIRIPDIEGALHELEENTRGQAKYVAILEATVAEQNQELRKLRS